MQAVELRRRLLDRVARSAAAAAALTTCRPDRLARLPIAPGVGARELYLSDPARARRQGEPTRVRLVDLAAGANWQPGMAAHRREMLVLRGQLRHDGRAVAERDFAFIPGGSDAGRLETTHGALLYWREAPAGAAAAGEPGGVRWVIDDAAGWADYAPGIRRRVLWQQGPEAAMLYCAEAGAAVPQHSHGHDEECLMLRGDVFLDDVLLRPLDWQLAPAGSGHRSVSTDVGGVLFAHGDVDLQLTQP
jgi:quercetin dioxygenase-like cupin family protein